jgi:hypothetical protein
VFIGTDPHTGRRVDRTVTIRANRADAERELAEMVASARAVRAVGVRSSVSELLEAWFAIASTGWAPTTIRQARSRLDRYLHHLADAAPGEDNVALETGGLLVAKVVRVELTVEAIAHFDASGTP